MNLNHFSRGDGASRQLVGEKGTTKEEATQLSDQEIETADLETVTAVVLENQNDAVEQAGTSTKKKRKKQKQEKDGATGELLVNEAAATTDDDVERRRR